MRRGEQVGGEDDQRRRILKGLLYKSTLAERACRGR